jgi:hypothetical protein
MMLVRKGLSASKSVFRSESFVAAAQNLNNLINQRKVGLLAVPEC